MRREEEAAALLVAPEAPEAVDEAADINGVVGVVVAPPEPQMMRPALLRMPNGECAFLSQPRPSAAQREHLWNLTDRLGRYTARVKQELANPNISEVDRNRYVRSQAVMAQREEKVYRDCEEYYSQPHLLVYQYQDDRTPPTAEEVDAALVAFNADLIFNLNDAV